MTKCLISYRYERNFYGGTAAHYGMTVSEGILSFLKFIKREENNRYVILNVFPLTEEEAAEILEEGLLL